MKNLKDLKTVLLGALKMYSYHLIVTFSIVLGILNFNILGTQTDMSTWEALRLFYYDGYYFLDTKAIQVHVGLFLICTLFALRKI